MASLLQMRYSWNCRALGLNGIVNLPHQKRPTNSWLKNHATSKTSSQRLQQGLLLNLRLTKTGALIVLCGARTNFSNGGFYGTQAHEHRVFEIMPEAFYRGNFVQRNMWIGNFVAIKSQ